MKINNNKGFTVAEIMTVVGLVAMLNAIVIPGFNHARNKAAQNTCLANICSLEKAIDCGRADGTLSADFGDGVSTPMNYVFDEEKLEEMLVPLYVRRMPECPMGGHYSAVKIYEGYGGGGAVNVYCGEHAVQPALPLGG